MKLVTPKTQANQAAATFKQMYYANGWISCHPPTWKNGPEPIYQALLALGPSPSPSAVESVLGDSWIYIPKCTECNEPQTAVMEFDSDDYGTTYLCCECLAKALGEICQ